MKKNISIGFTSLGCAKNAVDLQVMMGHLSKAGYMFASSVESADVILVNTCAFIESARDEALGELSYACDLKASGSCKAVVACGCFVQRYRTELVKAFPDIDAFVGIDSLDKIVEAVDKAVAAKAGKQIVLIPPGQAKAVFDPPVAALRLTGTAFAYLKIAEGCVHKCAYCAIPGIRGKYRSRKIGSIVAEAKELLRTGVKELNIIAQDPMLYGVDFKDGTNLVTLLKELDKLKGDFWIRVLYSYPSEITAEYIAWMNTAKHAVKYLDVPLQHTDPDILKAMARGGAVKASLEIASKMRAAVPGITLRTTVMTGFPGETPAKFNRMLADIKEMQFDYLGVFAFSPEEGTAAAKMDKKPSIKIAEKRKAEIEEAQAKIWRAKAKKYIGKTFRALVFAPNAARMESQAPEVDGFVQLTKEAKIGTFVHVKLLKSKGSDFIGEVVHQYHD